MNTPGNCRRLSHTRAIGLPVLLFASAVGIAACASTPAPTEQMAVSGAAVSRAVSAGGAELAPVDMQNARQKLDAAKLAMSTEDYAKAGMLAQEAQVDAQLAEVRARSTTARKAASELQESVRVLRDEISRKNK